LTQTIGFLPCVFPGPLAVGDKRPGCISLGKSRFSRVSRQIYVGVIFALEVSLVCAPSPAYASSDRKPTLLEEVLVTAVYWEAPASTLPMSVETLVLDSLAGDAALNSAEDITEYLSGVQAAVANGSQVAFQIRGIGAVDHQALTPSAAAVYSDGVFLATNVQTSGLLYDLDRVEVLKGPQGTLYGRNASSGAINFVSERPGAGQESYLEGSFGSFDRKDLRGALGVSIDPRTHLRFAVRALEEDPALRNVRTSAAPAPSSSAGSREEFGVRASLVSELESGASVYLRAHYEEDNGINTSPRNGAIDVDDFEISVAGDGEQNTDNEFYGLSVEWTQEVLGWDVTSITALEGYNQQYGFDFDGTPAPFEIESLNANLSYDRDYWQLSQELRAQRQFEWGRSLLGASLSFDDFDQVYTIWCGELNSQTLLGTCPYVGAPGRTGPNPASDTAASTLVTEIEQQRRALAVFTRNEIKLAPSLDLIIGARITDEQVDGEGFGRHIFEDGVTALNNRDGVGPAVGSNTINDTNLSGDVTLQHLTSAGTAYASISQGFKSGGFNGEVANNALHYADEGLFEKETVTALEIGYKAAPSESMRYAIAAFYQRYDSPQARIFVNFALPDGTSIVSNSLSNLDEATSAGVEASMSWQPLPGLSLQGGLTLLDTEIEQTSDRLGNAAIFDGNPLPFASEVSATVSASYSWRLMKDTESQLRLAAKYRSEFYLDAEGREDRRQPGYTTLSADWTVRLPVDGLELSVFGRNLLDEDYAVSGFGFIGYNTFRSMPRSYGIRARYTFQ